MAKKAKSSTKGKKKVRKTAKKTRRGNSKNAGLEKRFFSRIKQEYHDIDYVDKLDEKSKKWLAEFMEEDLGANFGHDGSKKYKKKKDKKESFHRNNARNRDIYSIAKATGRTVDIPEELAFENWEEKYTNPDYEDVLIDEIESKED